MDIRKIAVVTGGSGGIGKAFVERLAENGYIVWTIARESEKYRRFIEFNQANDSIITFTGDLTDDELIETFVKLISDNHDRLDLLINNAGAYFKDDGGLPDPSIVEENLDINFLAHYKMIYKCLPLLEKSDTPIILNVTSGAGAFSSCSADGPLAYRVSKAAANMMTKSLSYELAKKNVAIHAADPGWVKTGLNPGGTDTPENAVEGMWHLTQRHNLEESGQFWFWGKVIPW